jgi:hypothetical protein
MRRGRTDDWRAEMAHVLLKDAQGRGAEVRVTGYQFPDAADLGQRYSWHMVGGHAWTEDGEWEFRYPALTCDETPKVGGWLRAVAAGETVAPLRFTEPNLAFEVERRDGDDVLLRLGLDIEFLPPWRKPTPGNPIPAGDPYLISIRLSVDRLTEAADEWDAETAAYPGGLADDDHTDR